MTSDPPQDEAVERWLAELGSENEKDVIRALHRGCPCSGSSQLYEQHKHVLHALKADPRPAVRAVAIHLEKDALDLMAEEDEKANGFVRNAPGGSGRRETRRAAQRQGW